MYKLTQYGSIQRLADNASIPMDERNTDYQQYQKWLAEGNTPLPADPKPTPSYQERRMAEYGSPVAQIEYITEHGLAAWQTKVEAIKSQFPKT